jgi:hypothetical protein
MALYTPRISDAARRQPIGGVLPADLRGRRRLAQHDRDADDRGLGERDDE